MTHRCHPYCHQTCWRNGSQPWWLPRKEARCKKVLGYVLYFLLARNYKRSFCSIDQFVIPGNIIVRQRGTLFHPGQHVRPQLPQLLYFLLMSLPGQNRTRPHHLRYRPRLCSLLQGEIHDGRAQICGRSTRARGGTSEGQRHPRPQSLLRLGRSQQL